ncbi:MAG: CopG family transcriptional regulator [Armatimonadetes bacterium]|nr:CopG family transcriptional regulator [Armatimonadota bacterium]
MPTDSVRSTFYMEPALHQALHLKAAVSRRSLSQIVNDAVRQALREDEQDNAAFAERLSEGSVSYETFLGELKADGAL